MPGKASKRERLIKTATTLFHEKGYADVSLYDIAAAADMQQGNIYYYFKTKHDLGIAVLDGWREMVGGFLRELQELQDPRERMVGFFKKSGELFKMYARWGCPIAGLSDDLLTALPREIKASLPQVYQEHLAFFRANLAEIGFRKDRAEKESRLLLAGLQGSIHLAHVMNDPAILLEFLKERTTWVRRLEPGT